MLRCRHRAANSPQRNSVKGTARSQRRWRCYACFCTDSTNVGPWSGKEGGASSQRALTLPVATYWAAKPRKASMARRPFLISFSLYSSNCSELQPGRGAPHAACTDNVRKRQTSPRVQAGRHYPRQALYDSRAVLRRPELHGTAHRMPLDRRVWQPGQ